MRRNCLRVLFINQFYWPDAAATSQLLTDVTRALTAEGHEVEVLCGKTGYASVDIMDEPPPVTVLKSGVVDGMAYSLYSDGSIEAQMPEGMMRFASIDELRSHLDQRP